MTQILVADNAAIARAAQLLREGALVAFPTETVYGLGADAGNDAAVRRIFAAKNRPPDHPVIVHLAASDMLAQWAREVPGDAHKLAEAFWPGPLTLILPRANHVLDVVTGGQDSVGLRVPSHPVARALLRAFGDGIAAPSANRFGHVSSTTAAHVAMDVGHATALILDGGECEVGIESTIVAFTHDPPMLLRPGAITPQQLTDVLGYPLRSAGRDAPRASGTLASHYAPRTPAWLVAADVLLAECETLAQRDERVGVLGRLVAPPPEFDGVWIGAPGEPQAYAHELYANLRALDAQNVDVILIEHVPKDPAWFAVADRLNRAAQGRSNDLD